MPGPQLRILVVGDSSRPEFRDVLPTLRTDSQVATIPALHDGAAAPDLCFLLQSTPGEFSNAELEAQLLRWPLARFVTIAGALCEGEPRTGHPWPGQTRVYWHEFPGWWAVQQVRRRQGHVPEWALPRTSREDDVARQSAAIVEWPQLTGLIGVAAPRGSAAGNGLLAILRRAGLNACRLRHEARDEVAGLQVILWDDDDPSPAWRSRILAVRDRWPGVPLVALLNFPRVEDRDWLEAELGSSSMLVAKPYDADVLLATLALVLCQSLDLGLL